MLPPPASGLMIAIRVQHMSMIEISIRASEYAAMTLQALDISMVKADCMTRNKAQHLRNAWKEAGNPPCEHADQVLERAGNGYFTGQYICARCGAELPPPKIHNDR